MNEYQKGKGQEPNRKSEGPETALRSLAHHPAEAGPMQLRLRTTMAEEGSGCPVPRLPWASIQRVALPLFILAGVIAVVYCLSCQRPAQPRPLESPGWDMAELQLNHTGRRRDGRLRWLGDPALGRSFLHGLELDNGQLRVRRSGIYRLHIQVTLANCSSSPWATTRHRATLTVGICSPAAHSISLLRLNFHEGCVVTSQRLTPLAQGDTLCTNLTLPLLPSPNADETFFGVQWVHP
ncbi:CD70 antigen isoform X1 [Lutra lutra]|uniref:CD70 antigen isoform X1 n=1 Tax=Lutra lutra TaxID=9657 RepID=UPI001FD1946D|nr:CD70 antigen isoform X1 [Lutra lutra]